MNNSDNNITTNQKIAVFVLLFFSLLVVFLWFFQFKNGFGMKNNNQFQVTNNLPIQNTAVIEADKDKDTDGDGLLDIDELNSYNTSPYLEDSDSDGFSDFEEVTSNNDPNCPVGRICATTAKKNDIGKDFLNTMEEVGDIADEITEKNIEKTGSVNSSDVSNPSADVLSGNVDAGTLRSMLVQAGFDSKMLDQISDEDLMKTYKEILSKQ